MAVRYFGNFWKLVLFSAEFLNAHNLPTLYFKYISVHTSESYTIRNNFSREDSKFFFCPKRRAIFFYPKPCPSCLSQGSKLQFFTRLSAHTTALVALQCDAVYFVAVLPEFQRNQFRLNHIKAAIICLPNYTVSQYVS
jgi:hypothetical protein